MLCGKSKSLKFSGGVANVLKRPRENRLSKYLFGASQEEEEPEGGGGSTPHSHMQSKQPENQTAIKQTATRRQPLEERGRSVDLVYIELTFHELSKGSVIRILCILVCIGIVLGSHSL